jgi:sulfite reductase beta subunit-like hemoprotein
MRFILHTTLAGRSQCFHIAVEILGYKTFHMSEMPKDLNRLHAAWMGIYQSQFQLWLQESMLMVRAIEVDDGTVTRKDWDNLYVDYTATLDYPGAMFPRE